MKSTHFNQSKDPVIERFEKNGIYIRKIFSGTDELSIIENNAQALAMKGVKSTAELRKFFEKNRRGKIKRIDGFLFRPATFIKKGLAINTFTKFGFGVLIDPIADSARAAALYKRCVFSYEIKTTDISLDRFNGAKDTGSPVELSKKLTEIEARRKGEQWDPYNRAFGQDSMPYDEVLLSYDIDAIIGITIGPDTDMNEALEFQKKMLEKTHKIIYFYQYDTQGELTRVPESIIEKFKKNNRNLLTEDKTVYPELPNEIRKDILGAKRSACSLENNSPPSSRHPVEYHIQTKPKQLECKAYFEKRRPIIRVKGKKYLGTGKDMLSIVHNHQARLVKNAEKLLKNKNIAARLGINFCSLEMFTDAKPFLVLTYQPCSAKNHDYESILELMGYDPNQCKHELLTSENKNEIRIRLSVLQALDPMVKKLKSFKPILPEPSYKRSRIR